MNDARQSDFPVVYIVDDDPAVRDALGLLLQSVGLAHICFADARTMLAHPISTGPCCLVTDLRMPLVNGIELVEALRTREANIPAIIISAHGDIKQAVRALKCGATDFLEKPFNDQDLLDAINAALKLATNDPASRSALEESLPPRRPLISPREAEVLRRVVDGCQNKVIARELGISARTVEVHRAHVMQKLGATSIAELVRRALEFDILADAPGQPLSNHHGMIR